MYQCMRYFIRTYGRTTRFSNLDRFSRLSSSEASVGHNSFSQKTHSCGELNSGHVDQEVRLCGWLQFKRLDKFLILRDWQGTTQIFLPEEKTGLNEALTKIPLESVVEVSGRVQNRPQGLQNKQMKTGDIEVVAHDLKVLNPCRNDMPFQLHNFNKIKESLRMEYRYLDLRTAQIQRNLRLRSTLVMKIREFLCNNNGFVDVETPTLFRKTPGGAREFVVPTHKKGHFYTLPQSPQQFKQLLMVGGIDRYFQIARCYRDELAKPDRQPEFTQVDIEMSFINQEDIKGLIEQLLAHSWPDDQPPLTLPFPRMSYRDAMRRYGVDKPDTRFEMEIKDITSLVPQSSVPPITRACARSDGGVHAINFKHAASHLSKKNQDYLKMVVADLNKFYDDDTKVWSALVKVKEDGSWQSSLGGALGKEAQASIQRHLELDAGDLLMMTAGGATDSLSVLGRLRVEVANILESKGQKVREEGKMNFLWVEDFPLFLPREDGEPGLESAHHPFTAPHPDDWDLVYTQPEKARSQHYDLVLNGAEIGGGSIRIHDSELQRHVLREILKEDTAPLEHLITALEFGCPPHGGIALGLDRLVAILCNASSIRDVIAFPKSGEGKDLMAGAPATISQQDRDYYHLEPSSGSTSQDKDS